MSIAPHVIWSERFEQIGTLIERNAEILAERWALRALEEQRDAVPAHHKDMRNRLPDLLRVMGRSLARSENSIPAAHTMLALEHGEQRWHIGWRLAEVIRDYQILRLVIIEYLDEILEQPLATREAMAVGLALDEAISASVLAFVGFQETKLRESNRRLTDFLPVLSHELRNPLAAIVTSMEIVQTCKVEDPLLSEAHEIIGRQLVQVTRLLNDISDVSRIMRGQLELQPAVVDLRCIVQEALEAVSASIAERGHELFVATADEALCVRGDPTRLRQIVTNLIDNAAKYTEPRGKIFIELDCTSPGVVLRVRDTGVGIPQSLLPHIFDMFAQGQHHRHQGLGIGLALVRALVEMHGGKVSAASSGRGMGSEFVVELPLAQGGPPAEQSASIGKIKAQESPSLRILLVDDHDDSAQTFAVLLERAGHQVSIAHDGFEALTAVSTFQPDVILIDIGLPGMDGYELAQVLRKTPALKNTPLVAVTGYANSEDRERSRQAGFDYHLAKPVELESVLKLLTKFARRT